MTILLTYKKAAREIHCEKWIMHCQQLIRERHPHLEKLARLIWEKDLNHVAISHDAGQIGVITRRELR